MQIFSSDYSFYTDYHAFVIIWKLMYLLKSSLYFPFVISSVEFKLSKFFSGEGNGIPLQCSCLENPMDGGAWWAAVHGVAGSGTWLSDFTFPFHFHALEKETATHSSVLAWRIPGMGEPGGLAQSRTRLKWLSSSSSSKFFSIQNG